MRGKKHGGLLRSSFFVRIFDILSRKYVHELSRESNPGRVAPAHFLRSQGYQHGRVERYNLRHVVGYECSYSIT